MQNQCRINKYKSKVTHTSLTSLAPLLGSFKTTLYTKYLLLVGAHILVSWHTQGIYSQSVWCLNSGYLLQWLIVVLSVGCKMVKLAGLLCGFLLQFHYKYTTACLTLPSQERGTCILALQVGC